MPHEAGYDSFLSGFGWYSNVYLFSVPVHTATERFENATTTGHFCFVPRLEENVGSEITFFVFEKLCFRDGLVWTVGLTEEIKLRFQISPARPHTM